MKGKNHSLIYRNKANLVVKLEIFKISILKIGLSWIKK